ncbi:PAS domain-containing sensor histidine kinase [Maribacter arcticus]|uniref:histidine kinase n=1 Tax=Maribacter arcticus TaxID=561365 RepID=A0A1T5AB92_9FLAO|nr:PAS domain-containing sensor histidine kinase [Maribacter arcticus]SKB32206.1 PAS domain S-box-containing protein [Maribacter arcticus]
MKTLATDFLLKESPNAIAIVDTKLNFINYSNQWQSDFTPNKTDIIGKPLFDGISEMPILFNYAIKVGLTGKENINAGQKFILPSGKVQWLKWKISPIRNDINILEGLVIYLEDITADKRELELLQKAETVARIGGWEVDLQKNSLYWTKTTKDIHEVPEDFVTDLAQGINFYKEGFDRDKIAKLVSAAIEKGKPWDTELIIITQKGNEVWVRAIGEPEMLDNKVIRIIGTFQDIDERKKIELAHEEITERLKIATQTAHIGIWEYHIQKNELVWDDKMYNVFGVAKDQFSGVFEAWESTLHPEDKERALAATSKAISGEKDFDEEFRIILQDGSVKHIKGISKTIKDINGTAIKMTGANWDVTELKRTQLKLERNEESFIKTFDNSIIGMAMVGFDGKFIKVNKSLANSLGYSANELTELTFQDLTHPEDLAKNVSLLQKVLDHELESYQIEKRYVHKNGSLVYVVLTTTMVKDLDGNPSYMISQVQDITSKKEAEHNFKETSERLNVATRVANIGIWEYHIANNTVQCNDNMYDIYGIPKGTADLLDEWLKHILPEDVEKVTTALQRTINNHAPLNIKFRGIKPNGKIIHLVVIGEAQSGNDGKIEKIIGSNLDITALRSTELQLERNIESFTETFENAAIGMALVSPQHDWLKVNKSLSDILGYSEEDLLQSKTLDITHPDDLDKSTKVHDKAYKGEKDTYQLEKRYFHKDGHLVHVLLGVTVVKDLDGNPIHSIAQILDITDRIESEKKLQSLVEVTKSQNDSLMNFAHIVSHNLRSHSTNMTMLTKFLSQEEDKKELKNINRMISDAAESLSETITHLNDVVQVKTGALENLQSTSVLNTIEHIKKSIGGLLEEHDAIIKIDIEKSHFVNAVPAYLESIFLNILTNALKYSSLDRTPVIEIKSKLKKETVLITFKDNGQGIDLKRHGNKIFGMYKTFHKHKDAKGIGLFITKNQIEAMSGSIKIESVIDEGTTIFIELKQS